MVEWASHSYLQSPTDATNTGALILLVVACARLVGGILPSRVWCSVGCYMRSGSVGRDIAWECALFGWAAGVVGASPALAPTCSSADNRTQLLAARSEAHAFLLVHITCFTRSSEAQRLCRDCSLGRAIHCGCSSRIIALPHIVLRDWQLLAPTTSAHRLQNGHDGRCTQGVGVHHRRRPKVWATTRKQARLYSPL